MAKSIALAADASRLSRLASLLLSCILQYAPSSRLAIRAPRPRSSTDLAIRGPLVLGVSNDKWSVALVLLVYAALACGSVDHPPPPPPGGSGGAVFSPPVIAEIGGNPGGRVSSPAGGSAGSPGGAFSGGALGAFGGSGPFSGDTSFGDTSSFGGSAGTGADGFSTSGSFSVGGALGTSFGGSVAVAGSF